MRELKVICDRCGREIRYNENNDKLVDGDTFMIPVVLRNAMIASGARQVELCKICIWNLNRFIDGEDTSLV